MAQALAVSTLLGVVVCAPVAEALASRAAEPNRRPNFIVIFIDDMGYGDIEPFGSTQNKTPHLSRMAAEGMKLTSFYVASPVCTPSRAALMTGCYPQRVGLARGSDHVVLCPGDPRGLNPDEITIAEILQAAGYATGCFGKWHLGDQPQFLPTRHGFNVYFGIPYSNNMWLQHARYQCPDLPILRGTEVVELVQNMDDQATLCRRFTEEATRFIQEHREEPFFVYLPHAFVHAPRRARPQFMAGAESVEQAQVEEVDWSVGEILKTIRHAGVAENTLVLFTSDNGAANGLSSGPLRGRKGSAFEGGHRVPALAWWPGTIPEATTCDELATAMDVLPTFAALSGADVPRDRVIDGKDISQLLMGTAGAKSPHDRFFYNEEGLLRAVRSGPWKLFVTGELHNLDADLAESTDVAADQPDVVARLRTLLSEFEADLEINSRPAGFVANSRTLVPRPGVEGEEAFRPTLSLPRSP